MRTVLVNGDKLTYAYQHRFRRSGVVWFEPVSKPGDSEPIDLDWKPTYKPPAKTKTHSQVTSNLYETRVTLLVKVNNKHEFVLNDVPSQDLPRCLQNNYPATTTSETLFECDEILFQVLQIDRSKEETPDL